MTTSILIPALLCATFTLVSASVFRFDVEDLKFKDKAIKMKSFHAMKRFEKKVGSWNKPGDNTVEMEIAPIFEDLKSLDQSKCSCKGYTCGCCLHLELHQISLNDTACINITYLPDEYGFEFLFTLNGVVLLKEKISVKNPPPICAAIPFVHKLASLCLRFYNLDYKAKQFSGCADIEARLEGVEIKKFDLGCFHIPP